MKVLIALVVFLGCATAQINRDVSTTLLVVNRGMDVLKVYSTSGRVATVYPNQQECVYLHGISDMTLKVVSSNGQSAFGPKFQPMSARGWVWEFGGGRLEADVLSLLPYAPCR